MSKENKKKDKNSVGMEIEKDNEDKNNHSI